MARQASKEFYLDTGDGHQIYGAVYGEKNKGAPLLLIHGGAGHVFDFDKLGIPENRRVIVMHQRGMGRSLPAGALRHNTIDNNIKDIERMRQHLNIRKLDIFAWSFGAVYMAGYAFKYPQRCKSLTAYAPYFGSDEDYQAIAHKDREAADAYYDFHGGKSGKGIVTSAFKKACHADYNKRFLAYHAVFNLAAQNPVPAQALLSTRSLQEWKALFAIRQSHAALDRELFTGKDRFLAAAAVPLPCPVKLVYGGHDVWSAPNGYETRLFPCHESVIIPGAGHDVHDVAAQLFSPRRSRHAKPAAGPQ